MSHQQKRHERHEHERKEKQARQRQLAAGFNKPGEPLVGSRGFILAGAVLCGVALVLWIVLSWL